MNVPFGNPLITPCFVSLLIWSWNGRRRGDVGVRGVAVGSWSRRHRSSRWWWAAESDATVLTGVEPGISSTSVVPWSVPFPMPESTDTRKGVVFWAVAGKSKPVGGPK